MNIYYDQEEDIKNLLIGRRVTKVTDDTLQLDDGTVLTIHGNEGCGGCGNGWYDITELNDCPVNAITNVTFDDNGAEDNEEGQFRVFVYAQNEKIKLLEVEGYDNGYYGVGYWIEVKK